MGIIPEIIYVIHYRQNATMRKFEGYTAVVCLHIIQRSPLGHAAHHSVTYLRDWVVCDGVVFTQLMDVLLQFQ